jgi:hypothetical protein
MGGLSALARNHKGGQAAHGTRAFAIQASIGRLVGAGGFEVSADEERGMPGHALRENIGGMTRESTEWIFP